MVRRAAEAMPRNVNGVTQFPTRTQDILNRLASGQSHAEIIPARS